MFGEIKDLLSLRVRCLELALGNITMPNPNANPMPPAPEVIERAKAYEDYLRNGMTLIDKVADPIQSLSEMMINMAKMGNPEYLAKAKEENRELVIGGVMLVEWANPQLRESGNRYETLCEGVSVASGNDLWQVLSETFK